MTCHRCSASLKPWHAQSQCAQCNCRCVHARALVLLSRRARQPTQGRAGRALAWNRSRARRARPFDAQVSRTRLWRPPQEGQHQYCAERCLPKGCAQVRAASCALKRSERRIDACARARALLRCQCHGLCECVNGTVECHSAKRRRAQTNRAAVRELVLSSHDSLGLDDLTDVTPWDWYAREQDRVGLASSVCYAAQIARCSSAPPWTCARSRSPGEEAPTKPRNVAAPHARSVRPSFDTHDCGQQLDVTGAPVAFAGQCSRVRARGARPQKPWHLAYACARAPRRPPRPVLWGVLVYRWPCRVPHRAPWHRTGPRAPPYRALLCILRKHTSLGPGQQPTCWEDRGRRTRWQRVGKPSPRRTTSACAHTRPKRGAANNEGT